MIFPALIFEQFNDKFSVAFSSHWLTSDNVLNLAHFAQRSFAQKNAAESHKLFGQCILTHNVDVMCVGLSHEIKLGKIFLFWYFWSFGQLG